MAILARRGAIEKAFFRGGDAEVQRLQLQSLEARAGKAYVSPMAFAYAYARLGNKGKTTQWLEKAYVEHSPRLVRLMMEPDLKGMHGDPEFMGLVQRVELIN